MRVGGAWLTQEATQAVLTMLEGAGHRAYCVGGCVRDALIGRPVSDVDIATDAPAAHVAALAEAAGLKAVPTGIAHGTITVVSQGRGFEVTTFRRDVETFGRHAVIAYSDRLEDDAARRDFTINALYVRADGQLTDPLGGLPDLMARRIRFVGRAVDRIREDYLRILRYFRFQAHFGDPVQPMEPEALGACAEHAHGVDSLSGERIGAEMRKLLAAPDPSRAVAAMARTGVLERALPGADPGPLPLLVHLESDAVPARWLRRLAVLATDPDRPREALRLSRAEARDLARLHQHAATDAAPAALGYWLGAALGGDAVLAQAARRHELLGPGWQADVDRGAVQRFPITARDLMPRYSGPALGARLRELEWRWVASDFTLDRAALLA